MPAAARTDSVQRLSTVRGKRIVLTGAFWLKRTPLTRLIESAGGSVENEVTRSTDVLVRGSSDRWAYVAFGQKEAEVAKQIRRGRLLLVVHEYEFKELIEKGKPARCSDHVAGQPIIWLLPPPHKDAFERVARYPGPLDREQTVRGRTEQGFLRSRLFQGKDQYSCSLCGREFPVELMVAAHIKPRSECMPPERRDAENIAFAVCLMGCDALYERGFVSVDAGGKVVTASTKGLPAPVREQLRMLRRCCCPDWHPGTAKYFEWHHKWRFRS